MSELSSGSRRLPTLPYGFVRTSYRRRREEICQGNTREALIHCVSLLEHFFSFGNRSGSRGRHWTLLNLVYASGVDSKIWHFPEVIDARGFVCRPTHQSRKICL